MTLQYLAGQMSLILERLHGVTWDQASARAVVDLRTEAEIGSLSGLGSVVRRALELTDGLCWDALERGDAGAFICQATICAELYEFGVCARLLEEVEVL